ncbi:DUF4097 family beta strand repeat-containing protein [Paenibacillus solisilvae]|uniref:DUF4097 family beta strand repeat-containing protein n=1 Tax=Paenibacillus solisilvae TaxID=2486751 RepID=A0ABW0W0Z8_9BACL
MRNWIVIALILVVVGLIGLFGTFRGENWLSFGTEKVEQTRAIDASGLSNIHLEINSMDVKVVPTASKKITATLSGSASKKYIGKIELKLERDGDTANLSVVKDTRFSLGINILDVNVKLELPEQQWKSVVLDSSSGDSEITKLSADSITIEGKSGDMVLNQLTARSLTVSLTSGDADLAGIDADTTEIEGKSGNVALEDLKGNSLKVDLKSGDVKLIDVDAAELKTEVASGNIRAELHSLDRAMAFKTSSGDVKLLSDEQPAAVQIQYRTSSGNLNNEWESAQESSGSEDENLIFGKDGPIIAVDTGSGDLLVGER